MISSPAVSTLRQVITTCSANYDTSYLESKQKEQPSNISGARLVGAGVLLLASPSLSLCLLFWWRFVGKLVLLMKITSWENKWTVTPATKRPVPVIIHLQVWAGRELLRMNHFSQSFALCCPLLGLWAPLSLHERNYLEWRNTSMSPFPLLVYEWLYNWFFFLSLSVVPAAGAVITIYLGSLFHYSRAAVKPEEKCCVLWFMEAIWPVFIREIYRTRCRLRK